jgi:ABC-2 type transport system permease protein
MSQAIPSSSAATLAPRRPTAASMFWNTLRHHNRLFLRNPLSAFFSLVFPTMFLLLLGGLIGRQPIDDMPGVRVAQFLTPSLLVFAVISTSFINLCIVMAIARDEGILKRVRGTPLPGWVYLAARVGSAVWFSLLGALLQVLIGVLLFDVKIIWALVPAALVTVLLGIACFCALGLAVAALVPNGEAAPAVANFVAMPLMFVSGVFFPIDGAPAWLGVIGSIFPVRHFNEALADTFDPTNTGSGFALDHLGVIALWLLAGAFVAVRYFRWEPRGAVRPKL